MNSYKRTLLGSIIAFLVGTSCCWLSSLAIWIGGAAFISTLASLIEDAQTTLLVTAAVLLAVSLLLYLRANRKKRAEKIEQKPLGKI